MSDTEDFPLFWQRFMIRFLEEEELRRQERLSTRFLTEREAIACCIKGDDAPPLQTLLEPTTDLDVPSW